MIGISGSLIGSKTLMELIQYLTPVVNFGEVRRTQLAKSILLTSTLVPLRSIKICSNAKERVGVMKATGNYRTYRSLVKQQPGFLRERERERETDRERERERERETSFEQNYGLGSCVCSDPPLGRIP